jgi:glycosyltransferase involved in cell wall biosynthesis
MKFSVITPVLNGRKYLSAAIESVKTQSIDDWELLIVDGASTDDTLSIAKAYACDDARIAYISETDTGMYDALLKGIEQTDGDWICWLNSDDLYTPWCFSTVKKYAEAEKMNWCTGFPGCWDAEGRLNYVKPVSCYSQKKIAAGWHHDKLLGYLQQESIFFRRDLFKKLLDSDIARLRGMKYAGDFLLWRRLAQYSALDVIPSVLGGFRRHDSNMSEQKKSAYWNEVLSTNPFQLPGPAAATIAYFYRLRSARTAWRLIDAADKSTASVKTAPNAISDRLT